MAKTDKTAPFWVRLRSGDLASKPWHRCHGFDCDLPDKPPRRCDPDTKCIWLFTYDGQNVCACEMCSMRAWRRSERRKERRRARYDIQEQASDHG